ncbi:hypothetical protein BDV26DRAFT_290427 [Aspergillus bertholletiae]|uniref:Uncharacterized protein n=1 Tax=Aspergillus bertholletiae TaxID=1226010 RepID=A0A5N7BF33_9EURO|nr:hypothetical protein BDV26DRAFT_290427 [Aspergillus bertholletiae]
MKIASALSLIVLVAAVPAPQRPPTPDIGENDTNDIYSYAPPPIQRPPGPALSDKSVSSRSNPPSPVQGQVQPASSRASNPTASNIQGQALNRIPVYFEGKVQPASTRVLNPIPANIQGLDPSFAVRCGRISVSGRDIHNAISLGISLDRQGLQISSYPHNFANYERFTFLNPECMDQSAPRGLRRREFVVMQGAYFDGRLEDGDRFRAIYVHDATSLLDSGGRPAATYCGTIYHSRQSRDFIGCDVRRARP